MWFTIRVKKIRVFLWFEHESSLQGFLSQNPYGYSTSEIGSVKVATEKDVEKHKKSLPCRKKGRRKNEIEIEENDEY